MMMMMTMKDVLCQACTSVPTVHHFALHLFLRCVMALSAWEAALRTALSTLSALCPFIPSRPSIMRMPLTREQRALENQKLTGRLHAHITCNSQTSFEVIRSNIKISMSQGHVMLNLTSW